MKDNDTAQGLAILAFLIVVILVMPKGASKSTPSANSTTAFGTTISDSSRPSSPLRTGIVTAPGSFYKRNVSLSIGNASYSYQPYEEYIVINNTGREAIDITNWQLKNGKGDRAYDLGGTLRYFPADSAVIPQASAFVSPSGFNLFQNVVLKSGESAIVTTGQPGVHSPFRITSFKENMCSGYLEDLPEYKFTPQLSRRCPSPASEPGITGLDTECRKFIERMAPCRTPEFNTRDREGDICTNCVDETPLSGSCVAFIKNHFNYPACIAYHQHNSNFFGRTWRIFLGKSWEMWAEEYETIELFDQFGQLVDSYTY